MGAGSSGEIADTGADDGSGRDAMVSLAGGGTATVAAVGETFCFPETKRGEGVGGPFTNFAGDSADVIGGRATGLGAADRRAAAA
jgi:hypothetical protein